MSEAWLVAMAVAAWFGALVELRVSVGAAVAVALIGLWRRHPALICAAAFLLASGLATNARDGLERGAQSRGSFVGRVVLVNDPVPFGPGVRVEVKVGEQRVDVVAFGSKARKLSALLTGEQVELKGRLSPLPPSVRERRNNAHVASQMTVSYVGDAYPAAPVYRSANRIRRALARGGEVLPPIERSFFLGFVIGDDRAQPRALVDEMRASGLSHLSAVSGQNVAFVLIAAGPVLRRLSIRWRWFATSTLVLWFCVATRFEPSVIRAGAMAILAVSAWASARPASSLRLISLAVTAGILLDPFLVHAPGWWLSVAATVGIVVIGPRLAAALPGPRWLAETVSVTVGAQVGVAPVQLALFGGLPVVSVLANLLAAPVAGAVMIWALPAGIVAGYMPEPIATVLHVPTLLGVRWVLLVARIGDRMPIGTLGPIPTAAVVIVGAAAVAYRSRRRSQSSDVSV